MPRTNKYWETEHGQASDVGKNRLIHYPLAGVLQTYVVMPNTPNGLSKGVTLDLSVMSTDDLEKLRAVVNNAVDMELASRGAKAVGATA